VIVVALDGPIDAGATRSFSVHMLQHLLLTMVAAPLLILGAPITLALHASGPTTRRRLASALGSVPFRVLGNPLVTWSLFFAVIWGAHVSGLFEAALRSTTVHALEHIAFLTTALLFWLPVVAADPSPGRLSHPARILYLFLAMPAMAFLGLALVSARHVLYPTYAHVEGVARALSDQQMAGAMMWGGTMILIVPALALVLLDWMRADEREARRVDERLARPASPTGGTS
jgi:putative copper resistance protein D